VLRWQARSRLVKRRARVGVDTRPGPIYARGMSREIATEIARYVRFGAEEAARIAELRDIVSPHFREVAEEFYDRTRDFHDAHAVFEDEAQIERLKTSLVAWMSLLFSGTYDDAFFAHAARVGLVHVRVGLPQRYMLSATSVLRRAFGAIVDQAEGRSYVLHLRALDQLLDLALTVMLESYATATLERAQQAERSSIERLYASREHRHLAAIEGASLAVIGSDAAGRVSLVNGTVETHVGRAREALIGRATVTELFDHADRDQVSRALEALLGGAETSTSVPSARLHSERARERPMRWQLSRIEGAEDLHAVLVGHDITLESRREAQSRRNERLAAIGALAAGLAHEIRNPLNGALLNLTVIDREIDGKRPEITTMKDAAALMRGEIVRLSRLTTEFLDFAKPYEIDAVDVDLTDVARRAAQLLAGDAASASVSITVDAPRAPVVVSGDASKLEQVALNLLRNAVEAMAPGGGALCARVRKKPDGGLLEIEDDGPGVRDGAPIFDAFYSTKAAGTGLGLAVAHRIVTAHGGSIGFDSRPGKTVFHILIPSRPDIDRSSP
jgi:PAS domain S-box-containing protein